MSKKKQKFKKIGFIVSLMLMISVFLISFLIVKLNILPLHYLIILLSILIIITFFLVKFLIGKKYKLWFKILSLIFSAIIILVSCIGSAYIFKTYDFMGIIGGHKIYDNFYIVTLAESDLNELNDINTKIGVFKEENDIFNQALDELNKSNVILDEYTSIISLQNSLLNKTVDSIFISNVMLEYLKTEDETFGPKIKIIHTIKIESEFKHEITTEKDFDITKDTFTIYVSGIDTFGEITLRSRSDVNMIVTVNPKTYDILLVSIPRDYYVQLHDTVGNKDKLTHAGIYGVDMSLHTIEDLLDTKIDYYVRVNFSTLISMVDLIDGVDVYSDKTLVPFTNKKITIKEGVNHMNGEMALAFARERYAYQEGDRHRIQNQQDVISAIIKKLTSSEKLLTKYTAILDSISKSFQTSLQMEDITKLINFELDNFPAWKIHRYSLDGTNSSGFTYSMGNQQLFVMEPKYETVEKAKEYISSMKENMKLSELGI